MNNREGLNLRFLKRQILMNKSDCHASLTHSAGDPLDRVVADVAGAEDSRETRLQWKGRAVELPGREIAPGAKVAFLIALQILRQP